MQVLSCEICKIFKYTFVYGTSPAAASEFNRIARTSKVFIDD